MLIYRDTRQPPSPAPRWPAHLVGAMNLCRREADAGALVAITNPMYLDEPANAIWHPLPDDWSFCQVGEIDAESLARQAPGCGVIMVRDGQGYPWRIPSILDPDGNIALPVKLGVVGYDEIAGTQVPRWDQCPTPAQAAVIAAARAARVEILANRLDQVPVPTACAWLSLLIPMTYHLSPAVVGLVQILDMRLLSRGVAAMAGLPIPEGE